MNWTQPCFWDLLIRCWYYISILHANTWRKRLFSLSPRLWRFNPQIPDSYLLTGKTQLAEPVDCIPDINCSFRVIPQIGQIGECQGEETKNRIYCLNIIHCFHLCHYASLIWMLRKECKMVTEEHCNMKVRKDWEGAAPGVSVPTGSWWSFSLRRSGTGGHHQRRRGAQEPQERMQRPPGRWKYTFIWVHLKKHFFFFFLRLDRDRKWWVSERGGMQQRSLTGTEPGTSQHMLCVLATRPPDGPLFCSLLRYQARIFLPLNTQFLHVGGSTISVSRYENRNHQTTEIE